MKWHRERGKTLFWVRLLTRDSPDATNCRVVLDHRKRITRVEAKHVRARDHLRNNKRSLFLEFLSTCLFREGPIPSLSWQSIGLTLSLKLLLLGGKERSAGAVSQS